MRGQKASGIVQTAEARVEQTADHLRVPAAVIGGEQDEVLRGRGFRLVDEETFDELEHEGSEISRLGRRG
jgi:hypothetical protein